MRIPELDGLRGIVILWVVSFHYINNQLFHSSSILAIIFARMTYFGWVGVDWFFVLSGFLIGNILIQNRDSNNFFLTFYIRRFIRIFPVYYLLLIVFLFIQTSGFFMSSYFLTGNNVLPAWSYIIMVANIYMGVLKNMGNTALSVVWSVNIEEQFYIVFPFIVYWVRVNWLPFVLIALIFLSWVVSMNFDHWIPPYVLFPARMDSIVMGVLVACVFVSGHLRKIVRKYFLIILGLMFLDVIVCGYLYYSFSDLGIFRHSLFSFPFAMCLLLILSNNQSWLSSLLRFKSLRWIGAISYSLYLFHYLILGIVHHIFGNEGIGINDAKDIVITMLAFAISTGFSWLVYHKIENPLMIWGKRFQY